VVEEEGNSIDSTETMMEDTEPQLATFCLTADVTTQSAQAVAESLLCEGELINAATVSAASLTPHAQGRQVRRPKKPEDLWRVQEDMKQLRKERRWEDCKQLRRLCRPAKRKYHA
jgi:hypothetical protein